MVSNQLLISSIFVGGGGGLYSTVDKTTFADDTTAAVPGANLVLLEKH